MTIHRGQLISGIVLACLAVAYLIAAWQLPFGALANPGTGFFPRGVGALLALAALAVLAQAWSPQRTQPAGDDHEQRERLHRAEYLRLAGLGGVCAGYLVILPLLGLATTAACTAYLIMLIARLKRKILGLIVAIALGVAVQYVFVTLLNVPLPATPLGL